MVQVGDGTSVKPWNEHMGQLQVSDVSFCYGASLVLDGVSLILAPGKRIGLVGANGSGKSTLLRICAGTLVPSEGAVSVTKGTPVALLEQEVSWHGSVPLLDVVVTADRGIAAVQTKMEALEQRLADVPSEKLLKQYGELQTRFEALGGYAARHRAERCLAGLGLGQETWDKLPRRLSGGQQRRAALAQILVQGAEILLLDEPTNYLDVWGCQFLEDLLLNHGGAVLVVSHDRYFLDRVTNATVELEGHKTYLYKGNYSLAAPQRDERRRKAVEARERAEEEKARLKQYIRRYIAGQRHAQAQSRRKQLVKLESEALPDLAPEETSIRLRLEHSRREGRVVLRAQHLGLMRGGRPILKDVSLLVVRGEKLAVMGPNGSGKTSLLLAALSKLSPSSGTIAWGHNVDVAYLPQESEPELLGDTPFDAIERVAVDWTIGEIRSYLARFGFTGDEVFQAVTSLSGGERTRLALASLLLSPANVLVLDEPTNHLDTDSCEALEQALMAYRGTVIMVTHDRRMIERVAGKAFVLRDGTGDVVGPPFEAIWKPPPDEESSLPPRRPKRAARAKPKRRKGRNPETIETEIDELEQQLEELQLRQADPATHTQWEELLQLHREEQQLRARIDELIREWEEAAEQHGSHGAG
jgi:ATP-binding cassette subfamily F protein 3